MGWLSSSDLTIVSTLSGVPTSHGAWTVAVAAAESLITRFTGCTFGSSSTVTLRVTLTAAQMLIVLPRDVTAVSNVLFQGKTLTDIYGLGAGLVFEAGALRVVDSSDADLIWGIGAYRITGNRGFNPVPGDVVKAASLLIAWFTDLSDPERSRFENLGMGDFSGTMRLSDFPVPEARGLLDGYRTAVRGSL